MQPDNSRNDAGLAAPVSKASRRTGYALTALVAAFMLFDAVGKLAQPPEVVKPSLALGFTQSTLLGLGITLLISTLMYAIPRTSVLGAILLTGYLGGAVATNVRAGTPVFNIAFAVLFGVLAWGGLFLRNRKLQALMLPISPAGSSAVLRLRRCYELVFVKFV